MNESTPVSLLDQIKNRYEKAVLVGQAEAPDRSSQQEYTRPHLKNDIEWDKYEPDPEYQGGAESPIMYFQHKEKPEKRLVRIVSPTEGEPAIIEMPEKSSDPYLRQLTRKWKDVQNVVMLDKETLQLIYDMAKRYESRQPMIIEGPPARSKSFGAWVFSTILETPYARMSCSSNTKETYLNGGMQPKLEREGLRTIRDVLTSPIIQKVIELSEQQAQKIPDKFDDALKAHSVVTAASVLLDLDNSTKAVSLSDPRVLRCYDVLESVSYETLVGKSEYQFVDSDAIRVYEGGGIVVYDEFNTIQDDGVQTAVLPMFEVTTPEFKVSSQRKPPNARRNKNFFPVITQNPPIIAGRRSLSDATVSRNLPVELGPVTESYIHNVLDFFMTGNDPDIRIQGKLHEGRRDVKTLYRPLEKMPYRELVAKAIVSTHLQLCEWTNDKTIGAAKREGGFYVFDQRKIQAVLDQLMVGYGNAVRYEKGKLVPQKEPNWEQMVKTTLCEVYLDGIHGDEVDPESDKAKVASFIDGLPIWKKLREAQTGKNIAEKVTMPTGEGVAAAW